jgi:hypothetical protein
MGVVHRADPGWASHLPVLIRALELTDGPVLELGAGMFSTPLLHALCQNRYLRTLESDSRFSDMFKKFRTPNHDILLVEDWSDVDLDEEWSVALVDQKPAEARAPSIKQLTNVDYVVIHDSNDPEYDYESIYPLFAYRFTHQYLQHTTVLSNKHDVNKLYHP